MRKKYRIKNRANNNEFSALSGIEAFELLGGQNCLITKSKNTQPIAYELYRNIQKMSKKIKVYSTCGIKNCVKKDHLIAIYKPTKKETEYIKTYAKIDGSEQLAHVLKVPRDLMENYIKTLQNSHLQ